MCLDTCLGTQFVQGSMVLCVPAMLHMPTALRVLAMRRVPAVPRLLTMPYAPIVPLVLAIPCVPIVLCMPTVPHAPDMPHTLVALHMLAHRPCCVHLLHCMGLLPFPPLSWEVHVLIMYLWTHSCLGLVSCTTTVSPTPAVLCVLAIPHVPIMPTCCTCLPCRVHLPCCMLLSCHTCWLCCEHPLPYVRFLCHHFLCDTLSLASNTCIIASLGSNDSYHSWWSAMR